MRPASADVATAPPELCAEVLQQFRVILRAVRRHVHDVERAAGITGAQAWALSIARDHPGLGVGELARRMSIRQPTASVLVRHLALKRLLEARRSARDKRSVELFVLPASDAVLRGVPAPAAGRLPHAIARLDLEALTRLRADLAHLVGQLGQDAQPANRPLDRL